MYNSGSISILTLDTAANNVRQLTYNCLDIVHEGYARTGIYPGDFKDLPPPALSVEEVESSIVLSTRAFGELEFFCGATVDFLREMDSSISQYGVSITNLEIGVSSISKKVDELEDRMRRIFEALENAAPDTTVADLKSMIYYSYKLDEIDAQVKDNGGADAFAHLDNMVKKSYG